ncbi:hypothetical protein WKI13_02250 [Teredinibacter turnerae]|uniref:hypothetical protein n=1 Tax=Teredinibacter turnerae TaxID=2426 RepID=UPI00037BE4DC|nr:hypothetical protein [Teredinibacter turnerae]
MSIGNSGRIVIEIEPDLKRQLHAVLRLEGKNLKSWFLENVEELLEYQARQQSLPFEVDKKKSGAK